MQSQDKMRIYVSVTFFICYRTCPWIRQVCRGAGVSPPPPVAIVAQLGLLV